METINGFALKQFNFKEGFGKGGTVKCDFTAQNCESVFPEMVSEVGETYNDPDVIKQCKDLGLTKEVVELAEGKIETRYKVKQVGTSSLLPIMVKSIQELSAKNDALEAKVKALESA